MSKANIHLSTQMTNQHNKFEDGTSIRYLLPNKSYKMFGVQINPMPDFRDHLKQVTTEVRQLTKTLTKRLLSPNRKTQVIDQLLKSKYHDTHLGMFPDKQPETIDKLLNKTTRNAIGPTSSFPTEAIYRTTKETGLGYAPMKDRATQIEIEHITDIIYKTLKPRIEGT